MNAIKSEILTRRTKPFRFARKNFLGDDRGANMTKLETLPPPKREEKQMPKTKKTIIANRQLSK